MALAVTVAAGEAYAQERDVPGPDLSTPRLRIQVQPRIWLPRSDADVRFGSGSTTLDVGSDLRMRDMETVLMAEVALRVHDDWDVIVDGFSFGTEEAGVLRQDVTFGDLSLQAGDAYDASLDIWSAGVTARYAAHTGLDGASDSFYTLDGRRRIDARLGPQLTMRYLDVEMQLQNPGAGRERGSGDWLALVPGGHATITYRPDAPQPWLSAISAELEAGYGWAFGGDGGTVGQIRTAVTWHFNERIGVSVGYRLLHTDARRGDFRFDGGTKGLFLSAMFTF